MVRPRLAPLALAVLAASSALACQDLLGLTPGNPDASGGGGAGAAGGTGGTPTSDGGGGTGATSTTTPTTEGGGGSGGTTTTTEGGGGAGGGCGECVSSNPCEQARCVNDECHAVPKPAGTFVTDPRKGDCTASLCDGAGAAIDGPWFDPDDENECTSDACEAGVAGHLPRRDGTPCTGGVCVAGACEAALCEPPDGVTNGHETGVDCGGPCPDCIDKETCKVPTDCATGFCSSGLCAPPVAAAMIVKGTSITVGIFDLATSMWTMTADPTPVMNIAGAGIAFDAAGEAVAVTRQGGAGARFSRWTSGAWTATKNLALSSSGWLPAFARTDPALYVFAQSANSKHEYTFAKGETGDPFQDVGPAVSSFSGGAGTRDGHASFFWAAIREAGSLVETRHLAGAWTKPSIVLTGNYNDCQPSLVPTLHGALLVASLRTGDDHELTFRILAPDGPKAEGTILNTLFTAAQPIPKRLALAPLADGTAILAFRGPDGALDVRAAADDGAGSFTWSTESILPTSALINGEPALAKGLPGARAELLWIETGTQIVRHARWLDDGTWTLPQGILNTGAASIAIATP